MTILTLFVSLPSFILTRLILFLAHFIVVHREIFYFDRCLNVQYGGSVCCMKTWMCDIFMHLNSCWLMVKRHLTECRISQKRISSWPVLSDCFATPVQYVLARSNNLDFWVASVWHSFTCIKWHVDNKIQNITWIFDKLSSYRVTGV